MSDSENDFSRVFYPFLHGNNEQPRALTEELRFSLLEKARESVVVKEQFFVANSEAILKAAQLLRDRFGREIDQQPVAVDPGDPANFYVPTNNWCMESEPQARSHTQQGTVYVFANVYMYPEKPGVTGKFKKFNVLTGKTEWEIPDPFPNWSGALVTAGGLAFYGSLNGDFRAVDRSTGKVLWSRKLGSGIIGNPITYSVKGKQYVSVWSGIGGWIGLPVTAGLDFGDKFGAIGATAIAKASNLDSIPQGGTLYTFRIDGN